MIGNLRAASDADIARLLANPAEITRFLYGSGADKCERLALNRSWHAIHYLLTGSRIGGDGPLSFLASEGTPVGDVDVGYGPARVLTSHQVRELASALIMIDPTAIRERVDLQRFDDEGIYPGKWGRNGYDADFVVSNYRALRDFVTHAAQQGDGLVLYIN
jgi:Domain of unknown function (DUF1877)